MNAERFPTDIVERNTPRVDDIVIYRRATVLAADIPRRPSVSARVEPLENMEQTEEPLHPYSVVGIAEKGNVVLLSAKTGETFPVTRQVGTFLLALRIGEDNALTKSGISKALFPDDPDRALERDFLHKLVNNARKATAGKGPTIDVRRESKKLNIPGGYYYEDEKRSERARNFDTWNDKLTRVRFDPHTGFFALSVNGERKEATLRREILTTAITYLLSNPNQVFQTEAIRQAIEDAGYDTNTVSINGVVTRIRKFLKKEFGIDPHTIFSTEIAKSNRGSFGRYALKADVVELVEKDGSLHITRPSADIAETVEKEDFLVIASPLLEAAVEESPVATEDISIIALGFILNSDLIEALHEIVPDTDWPKENNPITDVVAVTDFPEEFTAPSSIDSRILASLDRFTEFLDNPQFEEIMTRWTPVDATIKSFIAFLAQLDKIPFIQEEEPVRGIELLRAIFEEGIQTRVVHDDPIPEEE